MIIKREKDAIIHTSDPYILSTALRNPCLHIRHWVTDFKQPWEYVCVIISVWDGVMDSMCGPQQNVLFHLPNFCVCTDTPFSSPFLCLQTFLALLINYRALYLTFFTSPPILSVISLVPGSCRLRHVLSNADKDDCAVHTADLNLYHSWGWVRLCY